MKTKIKAFTLMEIMIVVAIVGLLTAIAIPNFVIARERAAAMKEHPNYSTEQIAELVNLRNKVGDDKAQLLPSPPDTTPNPTETASAIHNIAEGLIVDKMVINNLKGDKTFTVVVAETNYYSVSEDDYFRSMVGSKPRFNKN